MMSLAGRWVRCVRPIPWTCPSFQQGLSVDCSASSSTPMMEGPGADSEEKHEPVSDIDTAVVVVGLKALDPEWPIREAIDREQTVGRIRGRTLGKTQPTDVHERAAPVCNLPVSLPRPSPERLLL